MLLLLLYSRSGLNALGPRIISPRLILLIADSAQFLPPDCASTGRTVSYRSGARSPATIDWPGITTRPPTSQRSPAHQLFTRFVTLTVPMPVAKFQPTPAPKAFR